MLFPEEELKRRISVFKKLLKKNNLSTALVFSPLNLFYFTGTFARGVLLFSQDEVKFFVNRPFERAKGETPIPCEFLKSLKELPRFLKNAKKVGIEKRFVQNGTFEVYQRVLSEFELVEIDFLVLEARMTKSEFEIECIKQAGRVLDRALKKALKQFRVGMREVEASAILEKELRLRGHPGLTRSLNEFELTYGHLVSGKPGLSPISATTGQGGEGVPGFQGGASLRKKLSKKEPILIDFGGYFKGYYIDQTRMASFSKLKQAEEIFNSALKVLNRLKQSVKAGISAEEVFFMAERTAEESGFGEYFMAHGGKLKFIGHGVGLQIDEPPVLARGQKVSLKENMVIALEPKFHVPELGVVGVEETFLVKKDGLQNLNTTPLKWIYLKT